MTLLHNAAQARIKWFQQCLCACRSTSSIDMAEYKNIHTHYPSAVSGENPEPSFEGICLMSCSTEIEFVMDCLLVWRARHPQSGPACTTFSAAGCSELVSQILPPHLRANPSTIHRFIQSTHFTSEFECICPVSCIPPISGSTSESTKRGSKLTVSVGCLCCPALPLPCPCFSCPSLHTDPASAELFCLTVSLLTDRLLPLLPPLIWW